MKKYLIWGGSSGVFSALLDLISKQTKKTGMRFEFPLVRDALWLLSPWPGCRAVRGSCLSLGHWSSAKMEQSETAGSKAAAVQLTFMLAVALIFSLCAFYGSVEEKANSEVRGHCVNQRHVFFIGDTIVHSNNNKISGTDVALGLWVQIFLYYCDVNLE